jgi:hypothetical protein
MKKGFAETSRRKIVNGKAQFIKLRRTFSEILLSLLFY